MKSLHNTQIFYTFDANTKPCLTVAQNEQFTLDTCDCFSNQLLCDKDKADNLDWNAINPAADPFAIEDVQTGYVVRIPSGL